MPGSIWRFVFPEDADANYKGAVLPEARKAEETLWRNSGTLTQYGTDKVYRRLGIWTDDAGKTHVGLGVWGPVPAAEIVGFTHLGTADGTDVYMPVTHQYQALNAAEEMVASFSPGLAERVRNMFDSVEHVANDHPDGLLYRAGTKVSNFAGAAAELTLRLAGKHASIGGQYSGMISTESFYQMAMEGKAVSAMKIQ